MCLTSTDAINVSYLTDQKDEDTAVDEGGPLQQFKTDCWKQLSGLSVPGGKGKKPVKLFEEAEGGINPIKDDNIGEAEGVKERARSYLRAIGRIMFNTLQDSDALPDSAMLPIFRNRKYLAFFIHRCATQ